MAIYVKIRIVYSKSYCPLPLQTHLNSCVCLCWLPYLQPEKLLQLNAQRSVWVMAQGYGCPPLFHAPISVLPSLGDSPSPRRGSAFLPHATCPQRRGTAVLEPACAWSCVGFAPCENRVSKAEQGNDIVEFVFRPSPISQATPAVAQVMDNPGNLGDSQESASNLERAI